MDLQIIDLEKLEPTELDSRLAMGWFRIQQTIFTTDVLYFNEQAYKALWLRARLAALGPDKKYNSLKKKNSTFQLEICKAIITPAHDALFKLYRDSISFDAAPSLYWLLYGNSENDVYDTYMINMYDQGKLIGMGFFDIGQESAAGICSIYDPAYKKFSLGKYMIYEKMFYLKEKGLQFFYPGYVVPGYAMFDYKLDIGRDALEYLNRGNGEWVRVITRK